MRTTTPPRSSTNHRSASRSAAVRFAGRRPARPRTARAPRGSARRRSAGAGGDPLRRALHGGHRERRLPFNRAPHEQRGPGHAGFDDQRPNGTSHRRPATSAASSFGRRRAAPSVDAQPPAGAPGGRYCSDACQRSASPSTRGGSGDRRCPRPRGRYRTTCRRALRVEIDAHVDRLAGEPHRRTGRRRRFAHGWRGGSCRAPTGVSVLRARCSVRRARPRPGGRGPHEDGRGLGGGALTAKPARSRRSVARASALAAVGDTRTGGRVRAGQRDRRIEDRRHRDRDRRPPRTDAQRAHRREPPSGRSPRRRRARAASRARAGAVDPSALRERDERPRRPLQRGARGRRLARGQRVARRQRFARGGLQRRRRPAARPARPRAAPAAAPGRRAPRRRSGSRATAIRSTSAARAASASAGRARAAPARDSSPRPTPGRRTAAAPGRGARGTAARGAGSGCGRTRAAARLTASRAGGSASFVDTAASARSTRPIRTVAATISWRALLAKRPSAISCECSASTSSSSISPPSRKMKFARTARCSAAMFPAASSSASRASARSRACSRSILRTIIAWLSA